jgi:hypothetical protein
MEPPRQAARAQASNKSMGYSIAFLLMDKSWGMWTKLAKGDRRRKGDIHGGQDLPSRTRRVAQIPWVRSSPYHTEQHPFPARKDQKYAECRACCADRAA